MADVNLLLFYCSIFRLKCFSPFSQESAHPLTRLSVVVTHTYTSVKCYISLVFITKLLVL